MNCGDIPWNLGLQNRPNIYGRYLQSIGSWVMAIDTMFHQGRHRSKNAVSRLRSLSPTNGLSSGDQPAFRHLADLADVNPLNPPTILSTSFFGVPKMWFHWFILNKPLFVCEIFNMRRKNKSGCWSHDLLRCASLLQFVMWWVECFVGEKVQDSLVIPSFHFNNSAEELRCRWFVWLAKLHCQRLSWAGAAVENTVPDMRE